MNSDFERDFDATVEMIRHCINALPKDHVKIIDPERYAAMKTVAAKLRKLLAENGEVEIGMRLDDLFCSGYIEAELSDIVITDVRRFAGLISLSDNFEIYPLTNGNIRFSITFLRVLKIVF